jgi:uncharacterized protein
MTAPLPSDPAAILAGSRTIAVVGCSDNPMKAAHSIPAALQARGYRVIPVNPNATEVLGERAYPSLADVPEPIDLVNVFRPSAATPAIVEQAVAVGARAVWLQSGIGHPESRRIATEAGIGYVENRCSGVEAARLGARPPAP